MGTSVDPDHQRSFDLADEVLRLPNHMLITASDVELKVEKSGSFVCLNRHEALKLMQELKKYLKD